MLLFSKLLLHDTVLLVFLFVFFILNVLVVFFNLLSTSLNIKDMFLTLYHPHSWAHVHCVYTEWLYRIFTTQNSSKFQNFQKLLQNFRGMVRHSSFILFLFLGLTIDWLLNYISNKHGRSDGIKYLTLSFLFSCWSLNVCQLVEMVIIV